jgi:nucleoside-diphosphate-sugar epimerase
MRMLVLGGTRFLGRAIAAAALAHGHEVVCAARGRSGPVPEGARLVPLDRDGGAAALAGVAAAGPFDTVADVATMHPHWVRDALVALAGGVRHWSFVSSGSVYADTSAPGAAEDAGLLPAVFEPVGELTPEGYGGAKVASEQLVRERAPDGGLITRAGLIAGPGDESDRYGWWPVRFARAAADGGPVLVPGTVDEQLAQVIDVRDLAEWLVIAAERGTTGVFNATSPPVPLREFLLRTAAGAGCPAPELVAVPQDVLTAHGVGHWAGPDSLPLWTPLPDSAGFTARDCSAARAAGLRNRPLERTAADALAWERTLDPGRTRRAGLSPETEARVLAGWQADPHGRPGVGA